METAILGVLIVIGLEFLSISIGIHRIANIVSHMRWHMPVLQDRGRVEYRIVFRNGDDPKEPPHAP